MLFNRRGVFSRLARKRVWPAVFFLLGASAAFPQQKIESSHEVNTRIQQLATAVQARQGDYIIGSGDLLRIEVFDVPELSRELRVGESGYISLPLLPVKIRTSGLTPFQLEEKLAELLQVNELVSHPQVSVSVKEQRSQPITVIGAVKKPLGYQALRMTTLKVLALAGGLKTTAKPHQAVILRNAKDSSKRQEVAVDLNKVLGRKEEDARLLPGDILFVPDSTGKRALRRVGEMAIGLTSGVAIVRASR